ncbi:MAG: hypothetical protein JWM10_4373, partial [Myxococcaceae bacterium]|nr:hypothetical protein [Myxococcaceae bacterium]
MKSSITMVVFAMVTGCASTPAPAPTPPPPPPPAPVEVAATP